MVHPLWPLSPTLTAEAGMRPGTFDLDPLRVRIPRDARYSAYTLVASDLHCEGRRIAAAAVQALTEDGPRSLAKALELGGGIVSRGCLEMPLQLRLHAVVLPGVYEGTLTLRAHQIGRREPQEAQIGLRAEVNCRAQHAIQGNEVYLHFGKPTDSLTAVIQGQISAPDGAMCLLLSATGGRASEMPLVAPMSSLVGKGDDSLSLRWTVREADGARRCPDQETDQGRSLAWRLTRTPGELRYELACKASPSPTQTPGQYGLEATLSLVPML